MTTPTTGAVARFEEAAKEMRAVQTVEDAILWNRKWGNIHGFIGVARDAMSEQAAEIERLNGDLAATRRTFASVVTAVKEARGYKNWPEHSGIFSDFVIYELKRALADARAAGVREVVEWIGQNGLFESPYAASKAREHFNLNGKGRSMKPKRIRSKNGLLRGQLVDKPLQGKRSLVNAEGEDLYTCPHCGNLATIDECDCMGAEPYCVFCNQCNKEFHL